MFDIAEKHSNITPLFLQKLFAFFLGFAGPPDSKMEGQTKAQSICVKFTIKRLFLRQL